MQWHVGMAVLAEGRLKCAKKEDQVRHDGVPTTVPLVVSKFEDVSAVSL